MAVVWKTVHWKKYWCRSNLSIKNNKNKKKGCSSAILVKNMSHCSFWSRNSFSVYLSTHLCELFETQIYVNCSRLPRELKGRLFDHTLFKVYKNDFLYKKNFNKIFCNKCKFHWCVLVWLVIKHCWWKQCLKMIGKCLFPAEVQNWWVNVCMRIKCRLSHFSTCAQTWSVISCSC